LDFSNLSDKAIELFIIDVHCRIATADPEQEEYILYQMKLINQAHEELRERGNLNERQ
jgi:hypothetical protein